ncbi:urease subunit alpha, partial [Serratia fonticola]|nr:urease subunit alpha [Serratia fonticola]
DDGVKEKAGLERQVMAVKNCRSITKRDLVRNDVTPHIEVDPETFAVKVDGVHATCEPIQDAVLNQKYFFG